MDSTCPSLPSLDDTVSRSTREAGRSELESAEFAAAVAGDHGRRRVSRLEIVGNHLAEGPFGHEPLRLHVPEDLAPRLAPAPPGRDLLQGERSGRGARPAGGDRGDD